MKLGTKLYLGFSSLVVLTMLLGGLWHGAAWNFAAWGALHGFLLVAERLRAMSGNGSDQQRVAQRYLLAALNKQIQFLAEHQTAPDGIWEGSVTAEGQPKDTRKAHSWKANYHDVRALQKFVEAFFQPPPNPPRDGR